MQPSSDSADHDVACRRRPSSSPTPDPETDRRPWGGWGSTRSTALAIRAFAHTAALETEGRLVASLREARAEASPLRAVFTVNGARSEGLLGGRRDRSLAFSRRLDAAPGARLELGLSAEGERAIDYGLGCTYRVAAPRTSPSAPFRLQTALTSQTHVGAEGVALRVTIERVRAGAGAALGAGQVVARVAIPGGFRVDGAVATEAGAARVDVEDGAVVVYWAHPDAVRSFRIGLVSAVAGHFRSAPSVVYP